VSPAVRNLFALLTAAALVAYFWWLGERFIAATGPTFDEGVHLVAGYGQWMNGDFRMNREDPPLMKFLWAGPLAAGDRPRYPHDVAAATDNNHWHVADAFLYRSGSSTAHLLAPARRVNLTVGCGVVLLAGLWAFRAWESRLAGLVTCAFAAFDPTLLALSCVLSTDLGLTFFGLLSAYLLWEYAAAPSRGLLIACGISLGLLLASKFSALAVVVGLGVAGLVFVLRGGVISLPGKVVAPDCRARIGSATELAFRLGVIAFVTLAATYGFVNFDQWGAGLKFQLTRGEFGDGTAYLNGELSRTGWIHYFLIVLPLKLPLGLLVACVGGTGILARAPKHPRLVWVVVPPLVVFATASLARVNLGVRVVLPVLPFLYILAGRLATPGCCFLPRLVVAAGCLTWAAVASWHAAPNQIAYFNELAGGPTGGLRYAADSNLDWGQGLPQLKQYMDREGIDVVYLAYFGTDRPEAHGICFHPLPGYGRVGPPGGKSIPLDARRHVVAISANHLVGLMLNDPDLYARFRNRPPTAVLGGSIYVFDLTDDPAAVAFVRSATTS
jgi:hypothetical protein